MTEIEEFNQPGINLLDKELVKELMGLNPKSLFAWSFWENGTKIIRYVDRSEYIRLSIAKKMKRK